MNIEYPSDYDIPISENRFALDGIIENDSAKQNRFRFEQTIFSNDHMIGSKKKKKRKMYSMQDFNNEESKEQDKEDKEKQRKKFKKKENYFQKMYKQAKKKMYINLFVRKLQQLIVKRQKVSHPLLNPNEQSLAKDRKAYKWNFYAEIVFTFFIIIVNIAGFIVTSLGLAFPEVASQDFSKDITLIVIFKEILQIVTNLFLRSSLDITGQKAKDATFSEVRNSYLKGWFIIDMLVVIIFLLELFIPQYNQVFTLLKFIMIVKLSVTSKKMRELQIILIENCFNEQYWELIKVFLSNFLYAHFLGVILILMTRNNPGNWLSQQQLLQEHWTVQYIWSYYWANTIMLTVGFGDLTPTNSTELIVVILIQTFSCIFLAYNINNVGRIIGNITSYQQQKIKNLKIFAQMQAKENISDDIKGKVTNYIVKSSELKRKYNIEEQKQLLQKLPHTFYKQFKQESTIKIFKDIPFFRYLSISKLNEISMKIQKKLTHPEQIFMQCNSVPDIVIANRGKIAYTMNRVGLSSHGRKIKEYQLGPNDFKLLSLYFFANRPINYDIICKGYTILYSLSKKELQDILATSPYCYQLYCMNRDKDAFNPNQLETQVCQLCTTTKAHHTLFDCPQIHYIPIKNIVVEKMRKNHPVRMKKILQTQKHIRKGRNSQNCLKILAAISEQLYASKISNLISTVMEKLVSLKQQDFPTDENMVRKRSTAKTTAKTNALTLHTMCRRVGQKIKQQIIRQKNVQNSNCEEIQWDIECDLGYDFSFYFEKQNPSKIGNCLRKKHRKVSSIVKNK